MKKVFSKLKDYQTSVAVLVGCLIISLSIINNNAFANKTFVDPDSFFAGQDLRDHEIMFGGENRNVVVLEYADLDCPFCKKFQDENYEKLKTSYQKKITFAYRHLPISELHPESAIKSLYALCSTEQKPDLYPGIINQTYLEHDSSKSSEDYLKFLESKGFDKAKINKCVDSNTFLEELQSDMQEIVNMGINSTPNFIVLVKKDNKYQILTTISGARNYDYFSAVIDQAIEIAQD
jgi:protein-disulfide isomerase